MRCAVLSIVDTMNGPADGPGVRAGPVLKTSGFAVMLRGLDPAGEHPPPLGVRLGERDHRLAVVDTLVTDFTRSNPALLAIRYLLSRPLQASTSDLRSSHVIGVPSLHVAFGLIVYVTTWGLVPVSSAPVK